MAIRKRHGREGLAYQVYWNNPYTGARESKTLHTLADARRFDSLIRHRLQHEVESFMPEQLVREGADRTVEDAIFLYLRDKSFPDKDAKKFLTSMRLPLIRCGHIRLCDFTTEKWNELEKVLLRTPKIRGEGLLSSAFVHGILTNLRTVLRWVHDRGMMESLPKMHVPHPNYRKTVPPSKEEGERLYAVAPPHLQRVIILGMLLGLRVGSSELLALTWENVDLERGIVRIDTSRKNPGSPWREVPIHSGLIEIFLDWRRADIEAGVQHLVTYNGKPVTSIKKSWARALKAAGITRRVRPYDLRHAFASQLIANGEDVGTVARLLGHSSPQMVYQHYQHISTAQKRNAVEGLSLPLHVPTPCAK
ncbi:MAG: site-specific integrase [Desulfovibrio sp.]|nr:site-specific integrase [Desulfovibrio sp.]